MAMPEDDALFAAELGGEAPELDLHGLDRREAADALEIHVQEAFMQGAPVIRVISGRGKGTLIEDVERRLEAHRLVGAVRPASRSHEAGAVLYASIIAKK